MRRTLTLAALFLCIASLTASAPLPYVAVVSATVLFEDGVPFQGTVVLTDIATSTIVKTWTLDAKGTASDSVTLQPTRVYRLDLIGLSGKVRESAVISPFFLPPVTSATFALRLSHFYQADRQSNIVTELQADLRF